MADAILDDAGGAERAVILFEFIAVAAALAAPEK